MLHQHYFLTMGPLLVVTATAFVVMILEFLLRRRAQAWLTGIAMLGVAVALAVAIAHFYAQPQLTLNTMVIDAIGSVFSVLILITTLLILWFTLDYSRRHHVAGEHTYLLLFAVVGALAMATAIDLITLYVGLELLSVASYVLVAVRTRSARSVEGGLKYLLMGSIGSAVLLYGMTFIYGISGYTNLVQIGMDATSLWASYPAVVALSFVLMLAGMGVKLALVPFHMWAPDAYDGAPSPVSAFLATLAKTAAFVMLLRVMLFLFNAVASNLFSWFGVLAAVTMIVGNLIALPQRNMKRLLAFSSVAQAGYVMVPFALFGATPYTDWYALFDSIAFYLFAYTFMTVGAFAVVEIVSRERGTVDADALIGLYRRSPWLAAALSVFVLSLAGMPLTAGFVGKVYIFTTAIHARGVWLAVILFATSVVSFYYYLGWLRRVFQRPAAEGAPADAGEGAAAQAAGAAAVQVVGAAAAPDVAPAPAPARQAAIHSLIAVCALATLVLGIVPASLLHPLALQRWF